MIEFRYRPEIDGLRAVAVGIVVLFHAGFGFSGGFVGVDVFFVISGFLITSLIVKAQDSGTFSLGHFWGRRIRRIIPAATLVSAVTFVVGVFLLLPGDLTKLAHSLVSQQLMLSNVYFYFDTGYFDGPSETKPLLHTWSLAVEEQFYLGYPLLLMALARYASRARVSVLWLVTLLSFAASEWMLYTSPMAAFYLLPSRIWELMLGALLVFMRPPSGQKSLGLELLSLMGIVAIFCSAIWFNSATSFPGRNALLPCVGAALLIYSNSSRLTLCGKILAWKPMVLIGKMSYSIYLWHWPILAFMRYRLGYELDLVVRLSAVYGSLLLAYISWRWIETPFRQGFQKKTTRWLLLSASGSAVVLIALAQVVQISNGLLRGQPEVADQTTEKSAKKRFEATIGQVKSRHLPQLGIANNENHDEQFLIWGDSHAAVIGGLIDAMAKENGHHGRIACSFGKPPLQRVWRPHRKLASKSMIPWNKEILDYVRDCNIKDVVLVARWALYVEDHPNRKLDGFIARENTTEISLEIALEALRFGLGETIDGLTEAGARVWIMKQVPFQTQNPVLAQREAAAANRPIPSGIDLESHNKRQSRVDAIIDEFGARPNVRILDPRANFFDKQQRSRIGDEKGCYYLDNDHISDHGAETLLRPIFKEFFEELPKNR